VRILITGANGYLGRNLVESLNGCKGCEDEVFTLSRNNFSHSDYDFVCDLTNKEQTINTINAIKPNTVFHLAANANNDPEKGEEIVNTNVMGTYNLVYVLSKLETCPRFVFASSVTIFGEFSKFKPATSKNSKNPISLYSFTKSACEELISVFGKQNAIDPISIRMPAMVGRYSTHGLFHDLIKKINNDSPILNLIGMSPGTIKPYMFAEEVASIFIKVANRYYGELGQNVLIRTKNSLSVEDMARIMMAEMGIQKDVVWSNKLWVGDNPCIYLKPDIVGRYDSAEAVVKATRLVMEKKE